VPRKIVTDQRRSYPAAKSRIPELANVRYVYVKAAARVNNRAENSRACVKTHSSPKLNQLIETG